MRNDDTSIFGQAVRVAREQAGLSLADAAAALGISKSSLSRLETGESVISVQRLVQFAGTYKVSAAELLQGNAVTQLDQNDYDRLASVVEEIEQVISSFSLSTRPNPKKVSTAVVEVLRLETDRLLNSRDGQFDPGRYRGLVEEIFRK